MLHLLWVVLFAIALIGQAGCAGGCWGAIIAAVIWLRGEGVLALPALIAAAYSTYSWLNWRPLVPALGLIAFATQLLVAFSIWVVLIRV
jgi:hypothetical protein